MNNIENVYDLKSAYSDAGLEFYFVSKGKRDIIKVIQYSYVQEFAGRSIYNLGFGDYDPETNRVEDGADTNNGDVYKVFNTVLSTIPIFFEYYSQHALIVQGSDGTPDFTKKCRLNCQKNCQDECRNFNRRINAYRHYVDKNFASLKVDYQFLGGIKNEQQQSIMEDYLPGKKYDSVILFEKMINFI